MIWTIGALMATEVTKMAAHYRKPMFLLWKNPLMMLPIFTTEALNNRYLMLTQIIIKTRYWLHLPSSAESA